jgi:beta-lactamase class A
VYATDGRLQRALGALGRSFDGYAAVYTEDLRTGRAAGWNADARFPAASTVKLGVLAAALARWHGHTALSIDEELRALTGWSSNLAANRLVRLLGNGSEEAGVARVQDALLRLGATHSSYPRPYRVGTGVDDQPPLLHDRVTTARDLGRILFALARAAAGRTRAGLDEETARYALGLLLTSERSGPNTGLLGLPAATPVAQKNGWITDVRDTAAIVYGPSGPRIVVVLTYKPGLDARRAAVFGRRVARVLR